MMRPNSDISQGMASHSLRHLPEEIIEEILVKLPVKSIIRFKAVRKSWFDLITSDRFKFKHLIKSEESFLAMCIRVRDGQSSADGWWVLDVYRCEYEYEYESDSDSDGQIEAAAAAADYTTLPVFHFELPPFCPFLVPLVGNCYGILCLKYHDNILVVNPSLGEVKNIPNPPSVDGEYCCNLVGFGFDNMTMDFKVVRILTNFQRQQQRGEVYSIRSKAWRKLDEIRNIPLVNYSICSTFFNGIVHFCVATERFVWHILTFNPTTELFQKMEIPQGWCDNPRENLPLLFVLNQESLAFVSYTCPLDHERQSNFLNVWIRNGNGIQGTWTKLYSIGPLHRFEQPVCFWKKDKLLYITKDAQLISYDLINRHGSLVFDRLYKKRDHFKLCACMQVEVCGSSLISINM